MRIGFFGTPAIAAEYLEALAAEHEVVEVVTQPDRPAGRSGTAQPSPVKSAALRLRLPVCQPESGECGLACGRLNELGAQLCVVVAFGQRLPCGPLPCSVGRCVNVHYSLLPKLRGAAPVQHAILQGFKTTGVTVQYVAPGWDEGDILLQRSLDIAPDDTCGTLTARLTRIGTQALLEAIAAIVDGTARGAPQDHSQATFAPLIRSQDAELDWTQEAKRLERQVRAYNPWPGAFTHIDGKRLKILTASAQISGGAEEGEAGEVVEFACDGGFAVQCGSGRLWLNEVQAAGKRPMTAEEYLRGARLTVGTKLGCK